MKKQKWSNNLIETKKMMTTQTFFCVENNGATVREELTTKNSARPNLIQIIQIIPSMRMYRIWVWETLGFQINDRFIFFDPYPNVKIFIFKIKLKCLFIYLYIFGATKQFLINKQLFS
jgi:hypothetical protein